MHNESDEIITSKSRVSAYIMPGLKYRPNMIRQYDSDRLISEICDFLMTTEKDIASKFRGKNLSYKRSLLFYFLYENAKLSFPQIGRRFDKHWTSVIQCYYRVKSDLLKVKSKYKTDYKKINSLINN